MMGQIRITQVRSVIGGTDRQRATVRSLGLKRIRHSVVQEDRPEIRGMIRAVPHLVEWEFLDSDLVAADHAEAGQSLVAEPEPDTAEEAGVAEASDVAEAPADTDASNDDTDGDA